MGQLCPSDPPKTTFNLAYKGYLLPLVHVLFSSSLPTIFFSFLLFNPYPAQVFSLSCDQKIPPLQDCKSPWAAGSLGAGISHVSLQRAGDLLIPANSRLLLYWMAV